MDLFNANKDSWSVNKRNNNDVITHTPVQKCQFVVFIYIVTLYVQYQQLF